MKKSVKVSASQFKSLIKEMIDEAGAATGASVSPAINKKVEEFVDFVYNELVHQFSEDDPVQSEYGVESWDEQCNRAADELQMKIGEVVAAVTAKLHEGGFSR